MNTHKIGLAVMTSQTSPTTVLMLLTLPRMVATEVAELVSSTPPFLKFMVAGEGIEPPSPG